MTVELSIHGNVAMRTFKRPEARNAIDVASALELELALACDDIVVPEAANSGPSEVKRGLGANADGLVRLPRQVPTSIASELVLPDDMVAEDRLAEQGLVNRIPPAGQAPEEALSIKSTIAANGPLTAQVSRQEVGESLKWTADDLFERQFVVKGASIAIRGHTLGHGGFCRETYADLAREMINEFTAVNR
jgi:enoyl-CoA hydratase